MTNSRNLHPVEAPGSAEYVDLVRDAAGGGTEAMERLLMRAQEVAFRFSLLVCGHADDAEDVMQESLMKTYQYVHRIRAPEAFRTWLYRTVRNACLMKRRRRRGEPARLLSVEGDGPETPRLDVEDPGPGPHELTMNARLGERLQVALQALRPAYRVVIVLREVEGLSTREVAAVLGISEDNVKTRLHRARMLLRQQLGPV